jgi:spore maturation protein CgeB
MINLNLQAKISVAADAPTMRTFEIAGCGGFPDIRLHAKPWEIFSHDANIHRG